MWELVKLWWQDARARGALPPVADRRKHARPRFPTRPRPWSEVTGICLHQTACRLGERPSRWDRAGAHRGITAKGRRIHLHDLNVRVVHGHGWNNRTVGIEVDGLYPGVEGDLSTLWDNPETPYREKASELTERAVLALKVEIREICETVADHGGRIEFLVAHRQSARDRRGDPGGEIWRRGALPMMRELGLSDGGRGFEIGGYPIPESWDPRRVGIPY